MTKVNAIQRFQIAANQTHKKKDPYSPRLSILALAALALPTLAAITYASFRANWIQKNEGGVVETNPDGLVPAKTVFPPVPGDEKTILQNLNIGIGPEWKPLKENQSKIQQDSPLQDSQDAHEKVVEQIPEPSNSIPKPIATRASGNCENIFSEECQKLHQKRTDHDQSIPYDYLSNLGFFGAGISLTYAYHLRNRKSKIEEQDKEISRLNKKIEEQVQQIKKQEAKLEEMQAKQNASLKKIRDQYNEALRGIIERRENPKDKEKVNEETSGEETFEEEMSDEEAIKENEFVACPLPGDVIKLREELEVSFGELTNEVARKDNEIQRLNEENTSLSKKLNRAMKICKKGVFASLADTKLIKEENKKQTKVLEKLLKTQENYEELQKQYMRLNDENKKLMLKVQEEQQKFESFKEHIEAHQKEMFKPQSGKVEKESEEDIKQAARIKVLEGLLSNKTAELEIKGSELERIKELVKSVLAQQEELNSQTQTLEEFKKFQESYEELQKQYEELSDENKKLNLKVQEKQQEFEKLKEQYKALHNEMLEFQIEKFEKASEEERKEEEAIEYLKGQLSINKRELEEKEQSIEHLARRVLEQNKEFKKQNKESERQTAKIRVLESELERLVELIQNNEPESGQNLQQLGGSNNEPSNN